MFYDCGHWAMIERKDEFESTVLAFLARDRRIAVADSGHAKKRGSRLAAPAISRFRHRAR